jgi:hypothetical protein
MIFDKFLGRFILQKSQAAQAQIITTSFIIFIFYIIIFIYNNVYFLFVKYLYLIKKYVNMIMNKLFFYKKHMKIVEILKLAVERGASDVILSPETKPSIKID